MATAARPLQSAVYAKLTASAELMSLVSGVYDEVPEDAVFPYVSFGTLTEVRDDAHSRQGLDVIVVIHVWSKYQGNGEAADIFAAVDAALDRQPLTVAGWTDVSVCHETHDFIKDPEPDVRHVNAQYRVWMSRPI